MKTLFWPGAVVLVAACGGRDRPHGHFDLTAFAYRDTLHFTAPARAYWCGADSSLEIVAMRGDSGIALAFLTTDSIRAGTYAVGSLLDSVPARPGARVAARWFGRALVEGYYSVSGVANLATGPELSGDFLSTMQGMRYEARQEYQGSFRGVRVVPAALPCGLSPDTTRTDSAPRQVPR